MAQKFHTRAQRVDGLHIVVARLDAMDGIIKHMDVLLGVRKQYITHQLANAVGKDKHFEEVKTRISAGNFN